MAPADLVRGLPTPQRKRAKRQGGGEANAGAQLQQQITNSQFSIATVLALFICIGVMIADRCHAHVESETMSARKHRGRPSPGLRWCTLPPHPGAIPLPCLVQDDLPLVGAPRHDRPTPSGPYH